MARVPATARGLFPRRHIDIRRAITSDFPLKVTAVLVAVIFWVISLVTAAPAEVNQPFAGRVPVQRPEVPAGYVIQATLGDVGITLRGLPDRVTNVVASDLRATLDMSGADLHRSEPQEVPVRVEVADTRVKVVEVTPATMSVQIEPLTSRSVAMQTRFANDPPQGTFAGAAAIVPSDVRVSGATSQVGRIAAMYATVRFGDAVTDLVQSVQPVAVDAAGAAIEGLTVDPAVVQVTVPVLPTATTRTVPIVWTLRGAVAPGYWITRVTVDPPAVTLRGESAVIEGVDRVEAGAVDVAGLTADRSFPVGLVLPADTSLFRPTSATIAVSVAPLTGSRPFPVVAVQAINLANGLVAETDPPTVSLVVAGPMPQLAALGAGQVIVTVDAAGKGPGTYPTDVVVRLPSGVTAQTVQPTRVTLTIRTR
jgi:YbbR domain-containing protein